MKVCSVVEFFGSLILQKTLLDINIFKESVMLENNISLNIASRQLKRSIAQNSVDSIEDSVFFHKIHYKAYFLILAMLKSILELQVFFFAQILDWVFKEKK